MEQSVRKNLNQNNPAHITSGKITYIGETMEPGKIYTLPVRVSKEYVPEEPPEKPRRFKTKSIAKLLALGLVGLAVWAGGQSLDLFAETEQVTSHKYSRTDDRTSTEKTDNLLTTEKTETENQTEISEEVQTQTKKIQTQTEQQTEQQAQPQTTQGMLEEKGSIRAELQQIQSTPEPVNEKYVSKDMLIDMGWDKEFVTNKVVAELNDMFDKYEITIQKEIELLMGQCMMETGIDQNGIPFGVEIGNSNKYAGAGFIQLTGKSNYKAFSEEMNDPDILEKGAEYVNEKYFFECAGWWFKENKMSEKIAKGMTVEKMTYWVTRAKDVTAPKVHLKRRKAATEKVKQVLEDYAKRKNINIVNNGNIYQK